MIHFEKELNPEQLIAAKHYHGPMMILAGAGSGKTRVITYRIAHLIQEYGVEPYKILAVTFTNKAAQEMKDRIRNLLGDQAVSIHVGTFHSLCLRILRTEAMAIGYHNDFIVYDDTDSKRLMKRCVTELNLPSENDEVTHYLYAIDQAKNHYQLPENIIPNEFDIFQKNVKKVYQLYQKQLKLAQAMDFGDLITNCITLFYQRPDILEKYQQKFQYLLIDEYQDTNKVQYLFSKLLAKNHKNICVVGDDDQAIYGWRGANVDHLLGFETDFPGAKIIKLEQNYRSTKKILSLANSLIASKQKKYHKTLWSNNDNGDSVIIAHYHSGLQEADKIISKLVELKQNKDYHFDNFAILFRTNSQSRLFEEALLKRNIPYKVFGGMRFYERAEIKDILSYLKLILQLKSSADFLRIINIPSRGIGDTTVDKLKTLASNLHISLFECLSLDIMEYKQAGISEKVCEKLKSFHSLITSLCEYSKNVPLSDFVHHLVKEIGYRDYLESKGPEGLNKWENVGEFLSSIQENEMRKPQTLSEFIENITLRDISEGDTFSEASHAVHLMTLHAAKGLEFPVVFLVGLEETLLPHIRSLSKPESIEEERRLLYVGITRGMQYLFISHSSERMLYGKVQPMKPSRFLQDFDQAVCSFENQKLAVSSPFSNYSLYDSDNASFHRNSLPHGFQTTFQTTKASYTPKKNSLIGQQVYHPKFGKGKVKDADGIGQEAKLTILFGGTEKKLIAKFVTFV